MAKVNGKYIAVKELYGNKSGSASVAKALDYGRLEGRRAVYNGVVVFDSWNTTLSASDFSIGASGGSVSSYISVSSYGTDVEGDNHTLGYTLSPSTIDANETYNSKSHTITVTQAGSGESVSVTCTQSAKAVTVTGYRYSASVSSESIGSASASGSTLSLSVSGTLYIYEQYSDGSESYYGSSSFSSVSSSIIDGSSSVGAYLSGGKIVVPSAGTTAYSGSRVAYTISMYSFSLSGETFYEYPSINVYQSENKVTGQEWGTSASDYSVTISSSVSSFTSSGGTSTITVKCQQQYRNVYASGSKGSWAWGNGTASLSASYGSLSVSSITGSGTSTLTVGKDEGNGNTAVVTASAGGGLKTASVSMTQTKRVAKSTSYGTPTGTPSSISTVAATGNVTVYLKIASWTQSYTVTYDNGTTSTGSTSGTNASATVTSGSGVSGTYINNGGVYIPSAGTSYYTSERTAYTITGYSFTANGVTATPSASIAIKQAKNDRTQTPMYEVVMGSPSPSTLTGVGGTFSVEATSRYRYKYTYNSGGVAYSTYSNASASVTYKNGVSKVSTSSFSGTTTLTVTVGENLSYQRNPSITVTSSGDSSVYGSVQITQAAASYVFTPGEDKECNAEANTTSVSFVSSRNGKAWEPSFSANLSGVTFGTATLSGTTYTVPVNIPANTDTSTRDIVVTATQTRHNTNGTASVTITQAAAVTGVLYELNVWATVTESGGKGYTCEVTLVNKSSSSQTFKNVYVQVQHFIDGTWQNEGTSKLITSSQSVSAGSSYGVAKDLTHNYAFDGDDVESGYYQIYVYSGTPSITGDPVPMELEFSEE